MVEYLKKPLIPLAIAILLTGCETVDQIKEWSIPIINSTKKSIQLLDSSNEIKTEVIEKKTISIACGKGDIKVYLEEGWKIKSSTKQEVVCTWKNTTSRKGCNINKDKGCKITVPDKMGEQIIYSLQRKK